ncbi:CBL-interacting serine/threonine-protein kinase 23-like isoform X2 [Aristolochia californica]|uniref:CBL-interacting serine/threonine-protein kinase 23-like isoform X2 n=1 Tax=Aristolochia californica TaxID=171875 RepID=UPI0035D758B7
MSRGSRNVRNRVGKYEIGKVLGEGTYGKVYLARDMETGVKRAIKVFNKERVVKDKMTEQIKREISTMKLVMASKTKIYFVLEYVTGGELFSKVAKQGKLSEEAARKFFQQLINAVDYCHRKGVYHRDLKLENLLLDEDGNLKISDFGLSALSQQVREDGLLHTTCGTPNYVAPEVLVDKGYDGAKADLWSCGVVLFVLMAGYLPFDEPNVMNLYKKIYKADFTCPEWFSSGARRLIIRVLEPNPKNRISIPQIIESSWFSKGYKPAKFLERKDVHFAEIDFLFTNQDDQDIVKHKESKGGKPLVLNAFDIISQSEGLNLSGLFEKEKDTRREIRFSMKISTSDVMTMMKDTAKPLGFSVRTRDYKMRLEGSSKTGQLVISAEVFEVSPSLSVIEMKKEEGNAQEFDMFYEKYASTLQDVLLTRQLS